MPEIEIHPATASELAVLSTLDHSYQSEYVWQMDRVLEEEQSVITFREVRLPRAVQVDYPNSLYLPSPELSSQHAILAALLENKPVGYIQILENQLPGTAWVNSLVVRPNLRRQGIGTALILAGQEWAAQRNLRRMICEMQSKNHAAIRLMSKLGYEFCGYNDYYYANQDIALFFTRFLR